MARSRAWQMAPSRPCSLAWRYGIPSPEEHFRFCHRPAGPSGPRERQVTCQARAPPPTRSTSTQVFQAPVTAPPPPLSTQTPTPRKEAKKNNQASQSDASSPFPGELSASPIPGGSETPESREEGSRGEGRGEDKGRDAEEGRGREGVPDPRPELCLWRLRQSIFRRDKVGGS